MRTENLEHYSYKMTMANIFRSRKIAFEYKWKHLYQGMVEIKAKIKKEFEEG